MSQRVFFFWKSTFGCILSPSLMNSAVPFPALARPLTSSVEAPDPIPKVNTLEENER